MRKVIRLKNKWVDERKRYEKVDDGEAIFHQFGVGYEEFEAGPGNFSTAIIEMPDGSVENIYVELIRFID